MRAVIVLAFVVGCYDPTIQPGLACADGDPPCPGGQLCHPVQRICVAAVDPVDVDGPGPDAAVDAQPAADARVDAPPDAPRCPADYVIVIGDRLYKAHEELVIWPIARASCSNEGGFLAFPSSQAEAIQLAAAGTSTWIGITDTAIEGTWLTVNGFAAPYLGWDLGEPDNGTTEAPEGQDCGAVYIDGTLDDSYCTTARMHRFVCECIP